MKKTEGGETTLYINQYYEKNLTTSTITTSYYLGDKLIAQRDGTTLSYIHQDNLTSSSAMSSSTGTLISSIKYFPFGATRSGSVPTDKQYTGQRLDGTGLYYYGARYYDAAIGRFISADSLVQATAQSGAITVRELAVSLNIAPNISQMDLGTIKLVDPQGHNRYSYVLNNPLKYKDPSGGIAGVDDAVFWALVGIFVLGYYAYYCATTGSRQQAGQELNKVFSKIGGWFKNTFFTKPGEGARSREQWEKHVGELEEAKDELAELEKAKAETKSQKKREKIQKEIDKKKDAIEGLEDEMEDKWGEDYLADPELG